MLCLECNSALQDEDYGKALIDRCPKCNVIIKKTGRRVVLEPPMSGMPIFSSVFGAWKDEIERPTFEAIEKSKDPFE